MTPIEGKLGSRGLLEKKKSPLVALARILVLAAATTLVFTMGLAVTVLLVTD